MIAYIYVIMLILQAVAVNSQIPTLSVTEVIPGATATFECSLDSLAGSTTLDIYKDNVPIYQCTDIAFTCSKSSSDNDYSDVTFTDLGTASAKGTFTVANADHTRDGGKWTCKYGSSLESPPDLLVVRAPSTATFSVTNVIQGATATFTCSYPSLTSPTTLDIYNNSVALYQCADISSTCSKSSTDNDYSDVTFTDLGTASAKGTFTVANADQTRDGGVWTCKYGTSLVSSSVTFVVTAQSPALLGVENVKQGATATFAFSYPNLESSTSLDIYKNGVAVYQCTNIASTCSKSSPDNDYSDVTFTELGTKSAKGTCTVAHADQTRDGGVWKCKYDSSLISSSVTFVVSGAHITQPGTSPAISPTLSSTFSSSSASSSTATPTSIQESETTTTNPTTTSEMYISDETNKEWKSMYFFRIVPTMITLTVVIIVITCVCKRTRKIKRSRPPSGMEKYSVSLSDINNMNPGYEPPASYKMSIEHSNAVYVSREHMLKENTGSSGTNMIHDQSFFEDTCTTK